MLADLGADVDFSTGVVRLPADLVLRAVEACPRRVLFAGASPEYDVVLDDGEPAHFCSSGCAAFVLDHETGVRRPSTLADLQAATILLDEVPEVDVMWTTITAGDVPVEVRELVVCYVVLTEARKHVTLVDSPSQAEPLLRIMDVVSGGAEAFRERPRFSTLLTAASPLRIDGPLLDFHAATARRGAPVEVYTVPMAGATSPVTLAGTIVQGLAEFLGVATALQALAPGARTVMGVSGSIMDMRSAGVSYASPECALMNVACVELAHHLGVPAAVPGLATDAKYAGLQAGYEKALKGLADGRRRRRRAERRRRHDRLGQHAVPAADRAGRGDRRDDPPHPRRRRHAARGDDGRHDRAGRHRRRLPQGEGDGAAAAGRRALHRPPSRRARRTDQWVADGRDEVTRARERMDALFAARAERGRPLDDAARAELAAICGVTPEMERALGD